MDRKLIAVAVSTALGLPMAADAVEISASGHVNRAVVRVDGTGKKDIDGELQHKDSNASQSRFRFKGSEDMGNGWTAGVNLEYGLSTNVRHAAVDVSGAGGKVTLGHSSVATDGMAHADLGGLSWLGGVTNWCSYYSAGAACPSNDGGRMPMLRYDTPAIGPLKLSASMARDDYWDVKAVIASSFGDLGYDIRIGYQPEYETTGAPTATITDRSEQGMMSRMKDDDSHTHRYDHSHDMKPGVTSKKGDTITASGALGLGQGTSVAVAWSDNSSSGNTYMYAKLDHNYGDGSIGAYYKQGETKKGGNTDEGMLWGVGIGHAVGAGAQVYAGYRMIESDSLKDDVSLMVVGMRVTFN